MEETKKSKLLEKYRNKLGKGKGKGEGEMDRVPEDNFSLWNNPMVKDIEKNMSESDKLKYKIEGEYMYNSINFENPEENKINELVAYIAEMLKSGMHPSYLSEEDKQTLESVYGKEWYTRFGYKSEDLSSISV